MNLNLHMVSPLLQLAVLLLNVFVLRAFWEQNENLDNVSACKGLSETGGACSTTSCSFISPAQASSKLGKVFSAQDPGGSALSLVAGCTECSVQAAAANAKPVHMEKASCSPLGTF